MNRHRALRGLQAWAAGLAVCGMIVTPAQAVDMPFGLRSAETKSAVAVCAAERSPLAARQQEYADLRRARLGAAVAEGAKAGASVFLRGFLGGLTGGQGVGAAQTPGASGGGDLVSQALNLKIPGLGPRAVNTPYGAPYNPTAGQQGGDHTGELLAVSLLVAVVGTLDAYMKLKQQQFDYDGRRIAVSIEGDAATQVPVGAETATEVTSLAQCRERQVADLRGRLSAASNDKDRKQLNKEKTGLTSALKSDLDMSDEVVGQEVTLAKTFTQGRAMAEGKSESDVLGAQPPAYAVEASKIPLKLPPRDPATPGAPAAAPALTLVTTRSTAVRVAPNSSASIILNFAPGRTVVPKARAVDDASWWQIDVGGSPGFVRGVDLAEPGAEPAEPPPPEPVSKTRRGGAKTVAKAKAKAEPPQLAPPTNIRTFNHEVLVAKMDGVDRLKMLSTDIQVGRLTPPGQGLRRQASVRPA